MVMRLSARYTFAMEQLSGMKSLRTNFSTIAWLLFVLLSVAFALDVTYALSGYGSSKLSDHDIKPAVESPSVNSTGDSRMMLQQMGAVSFSSRLLTDPKTGTRLRNKMRKTQR